MAIPLPRLRHARMPGSRTPVPATWMVASTRRRTQAWTAERRRSRRHAHAFPGTDGPRVASGPSARSGRRSSGSRSPVPITTSSVSTTTARPTRPASFRARRSSSSRRPAPRSTAPWPSISSRRSAGGTTGQSARASRREAGPSARSGAPHATSTWGASTLTTTGTATPISSSARRDIPRPTARRPRTSFSVAGLVASRSLTRCSSRTRGRTHPRTSAI